jgi:hypothetical protein
MAFTHVQGAHNSSAGSVSSLTATFGANTTAGNCVVGIVQWGATTNNLTQVNDGVNIYTILDTVLNNDGSSASSFIGANIVGGTTVINCTFSPATGNIVIITDEYSGGATAGQPDQHTGRFQARPGTGTDAISSGNVTTTVNGDLIYGGAFDISGSGTTFTAGTGSVIRTTDSGLSRTGASDDKVQSTAGSVAATFTGNQAGADYYSFLIAVKPASGAVQVLDFFAVDPPPLPPHFFKAVQQQYSAWGPHDPTIRIRPFLFDSKVELRPKFRAHQQQYESYNELGNVPTQFIAEMWMEWPNPTLLFKKPFNVSQQQYVAYNNLGNVPTQFIAEMWPDWPNLPLLTKKPFSAAQQQDSTWDPQVISTAVQLTTVYSEWPQVVEPKFKAALQDFGPIISPPIILTPVFSPSPDITQISFKASEQQYETLGLPVATVYQIWSEWPQAVIKSFNASNQQYESYNQLGNVPTAFVNQSWLEWPQITVKPFNAAQQQDVAYTTLITPIFISGQIWEEWPQVTIKPFNSAQQEYVNYNQLGNVPTQFVAPGWGTQPQEIVAKPFNFALQEIISQNSSPIAVPIPPGVGLQFQFPDVTIKPLNAALQEIIISYAVQQVPTQFVVPGWGTQPQEIVRKAFNSSLHEIISYAAQQVPTQFVAPGWGVESPQIVKKPFPSTQQQVTAYGVMGNVPTLFVPPAYEYVQDPKHFHILRSWMDNAVSQFPPNIPPPPPKGIKFEWIIRTRRRRR